MAYSVNYDLEKYLMTWKNVHKSKSRLLLLLLLSRFSRVQLCATPETVAPQAPPSLGLSRQLSCGRVGCCFLLQCMKVKSEREVAQSCPTLGDPMDCTQESTGVGCLCLLQSTGHLSVSSKVVLHSTGNCIRCPGIKHGRNN